jgi:hypothetical protein
VKQTHNTMNTTNFQMLHPMTTNTAIKISHRTKIYVTDLATKISISGTMIDYLSASPGSEYLP